jgi:Uma2 family endonuclease
MPKATYDDLIRVPDDKIAELVDGELNASPRPRVRHSRAIGCLFQVLNETYDARGKGRGGWWLLIEPEIHLGDDVFVPDIVGWRTSTLPELPDEPWIETVPDWVCEVLSPSTGDWDASVKLPAYARHGVPFAWLVDPGAHVFRSFARRDGEFELVDTWTGNCAVSTVPFEDFALELSGIWLR